MEIITTNKLTNVFGICFDFELPKYNEEIILPIPNLIEYNEALENWNEFFEWTEENAPEIEITSICSLTLSRDIVDGDFDMHFLSSAISFNVPHFDKYITMIYRAHPVATDTTYEFYMKVKSYLGTMNQFFGDTDKAEVLIGISGITDYNKNDEIYEFREHIGNGFEVFANDVLILKHFGIDQVTFFSSDTFMEDGQLLPSVFDA